MKYALIGCGRIATNHVKAVVNNGLEFVAACDIVPEKIEQLLAKHGLESDASIARYADYRAMLADHPDLDLVAIATESGKHAAIALECIDAGMNVIIEKPMAMSIADADEIIRRSEERHVVVSACHQNRFNVAVQKTREAVEKGRFGRLSHGSIHVRWNRNKDYYAQAPWRGTWAEDGGCLMNQCIHGIDLLRWMMGDEVEEVFGTTRQQFHDYLEAEDVGMAVVKFKNGAIGTIEGTTNVYPHIWKRRCTCSASGARSRWVAPLPTTSTRGTSRMETEDDVATRGLEEETSNVYGNGHTSLYADVMEAIEPGESPMSTRLPDATRLKWCWQFTRARRRGNTRSSVLDEFASVEMAGEFDA